MKKKNGFVFVETMIVVVTVLVSLLLIYAAYADLVRVERKRVRYDDPAFIYKTYAVGKFLLTLYDDDGNTIIGSKIKENKENNSERKYINVTTSDIELFSSEYGNGNEKRKSFFSSLFNNMNIQNIIIISKKNMDDIEKDRNKYSEIPKNFLNYILSIDTSSESNNPYYLIIEYAEKIDGSQCSPNQLMNGATSSNNSKYSESSCTFFYSNLKIEGVY